MAELVGDREQVVKLEGERLTIGTSNSNDVVLEDVNVSRFHAEVVATGNLLELRDLDSRCGTRLNGRPVKRAVIQTGGEIGIGPYRLRFDGSSFIGRNQRGSLRLSARDVGVRVDGTQILDDASLEVEPGQLVAIIGESGSGKTTLIKALAGVAAPTTGTVTLNGEPVTARLTDVGYVPQEEIVHRLLTVNEALRYAARLRLPHDTQRAHVQATIVRVLAEVSLEEQADIRIGSLSGGQRKRAGVATELLGRPSMLFLDEPTTGLDPALESQMMQLFRDLAQQGSRAVIVVTHATKNLALCDRLAVMGRGGDLAFFGSPAEAVEFFGVESYDEIYTALAGRPPGEWRREFERRRPPLPRVDPEVEMPEPGPAGSPRAKHRAGPLTGVLVARYLRLLARDHRNLLILFGQVPVIALGIAFLFQSGVFRRAGVGLPAAPGSPRDAIQLLFMLATTAIWLGAISAAREIIKERSVAAREHAVGVRWSAYLTSKLVVLFGLTALQTTMLTYTVVAIRPLDEPVSTYLEVTGLLLMTSFGAVGMGLLISAAVSSQDQATSFIPLALIPQLLFAGAVVPVARMAEPIGSLSNAVFERWTLAGLGNAIDVNARIAAVPRFREANDYGTSFFETTPPQAAFILLGFIAAFVLATYLLLALRRG